MASDFTKLPRIYNDRTFTANATVRLESAQTHYLKNVLRRKPGDFVRLFNGRDGEWLAEILSFESGGCVVTMKGKIREQPSAPIEMHLLVPPVKKDRMDFIIEKAVELGVTDIHPVLTARTEIRKINEERLRAQIIESAEQCERFEIPHLHPLTEFKSKITGWAGKPVLWCCERGLSPHISTFKEGPWAFLVGPVGGFDNDECVFLGNLPNVSPVSLGETVLRVETAVALALSYAKIQGRK